jgi:phage protein D
LPLSEILTSQRTPSARIMANGSLVPGLIDVEVTCNSHFSSDRFSASLALDVAPPYGDVFWSSESKITIQVLFSLDSISFVSLFTGTVDTIAINATKRLVHITGRDLSAQLIEARTQETFSNRTSSEIASLLANRHGLNLNVVQTTTPVGRYYQDEHDRITLGQFSRATTEWDLLVFLAQQEGFDVSVTGTTLNFCPSNNTAVAPYMVIPTNCIDMKLERHLTLAQDIAVTVRSWNSRQKSAFTQTVTGVSSAVSSSGGPSQPQQYVFVHPNLTADQALRFAQQRLIELTMHERAVEFLVPGDLSLTPNGQLVVTATGTEFDQTYYIDLVERRLSLNDGFTQRVRAKSSSPRSTSISQTGAAGATAS